MLQNKTVLITGGTGSFGHFITHALLGLGVRETRIFSRDEKKQHDMRELYRDRRELAFVLGDIRNRQAVFDAMKGVDVVFQAAALKQAPTAEHFPLEAIQTNVLEVENVVAAALQHRVETFVVISTDKAIKPVSVMGMTKALQERIVLQSNLSRLNSGTRLACVRFGNVLGSRGSVVPTFRRQLRLGQRLTITDRPMTRFLLTSSDAVELLLEAVESAQGGEIFVRKVQAGRLMDIAAVLAEEAGRQVEFDEIGLRPGEKLNEILISEEELVFTEDLGNYYKIRPWWSKARLQALPKEYTSRDYLVEPEQIKSLIARADRELKALGAGPLLDFQN